MSLIRVWERIPTVNIVIRFSIFFFLLLFHRVPGVTSPTYLGLVRLAIGISLPYLARKVGAVDGCILDDDVSISLKAAGRAEAPTNLTEGRTARHTVMGKTSRPLSSNFS